MTSDVFAYPEPMVPKIFYDPEPIANFSKLGIQKNYIFEWHIFIK